MSPLHSLKRLRESQNPPLSGLQKQGHSNDNAGKSENGMQENGDKSGYDKKENSDKKHSLKISSEYETGIDSQSQSDEKAGFHETMQSNDSEIVRSNEQ